MILKKYYLVLLIDLKFLNDRNFKSGETNYILAPKEQPPRKLSGKRTDQSITLWKEIHFRRRSKTLRQKYRWGNKSAMPDKYINIHTLKVSESLLNFVNEELLTDTGVSTDQFWLGFEKIVNELEPKNRELINIRKLYKKKLMIGILKIKAMKLN